MRVSKGGSEPCNGFIYDTEVRGFGVKVTPAGRRVYVVQYRVGGGRRAFARRYTIGQHGSPWTVETARTEAKRILGEVAGGADPAARRAANRDALTVSELCDLYLVAAEKGLINGKRGRPKKVSTLATDRGRVARHIKPLLGRQKVINLTPADCAKFMRDVAAGRTATDVRRQPDDGMPQEPSKTAASGKVVYSDSIKRRGRAIVRGGRGTATRTLGLLGGILTFAVSEGVRSDNPVREVERYAYRKRKVVLTPDQYRALGLALEEAEREGENRKAVAAVRLIALTGCRRGEIARLQRDEVDERARCFRLADTKEHESIRPIGEPAFDVIRELRFNSVSPFVFPSEDDEGAYGGLPKAWLRIRARAEGLAALTCHGLRHAFASVANQLGYTEATRAALLGHTGSRSQTGDYTHHLDAVLVAAANRVSRHIHSMMVGATAEVVQLPTRVA
jgi:integrase